MNEMNDNMKNNQENNACDNTETYSSSNESKNWDAANTAVKGALLTALGAGICFAYKKLTKHDPPEEVKTLLKLGDIEVIKRE